MILRRCVFTSFAGVFFTSVVVAEEPQSSYIFGVFPHVPKSKLLHMYLPVAMDFEKKLGHAVSVRTKGSYNKFETAIATQTYDIALIQPFDYPDAYDKYHYLPVARRSDQLSAVLVVKKESTFQSLEELKGEILASTAKSAAVSRLIDSVILKHGMDPENDFSRVYKNNHFSCMQTVLIGLAAACSTSHRALDHYYKVKLKDRFRIVAESQKIPHVLFVVHQRVPKKDRDIIKSTILNWQNTPEGKNILSGSQMSFFTEAKNEEYNVLR